MENCAHAQRDAEALQTFRDHINEMTDNGRAISAHRLYTSVWDIFRVQTQKRHRSRVLQGLRLVSNDAESPPVRAA